MTLCSILINRPPKAQTTIVAPLADEAWCVALSPSTEPLLTLSSNGAQRACCASERSAQRFWGPLETKKVLRVTPMSATRTLRADVTSPA